MSLGPSSLAVLPDHPVGVAEAPFSFPLKPEQVGSWLLRIQPFMESSEIVSLWRTPATIDDNGHASNGLVSHAGGRLPAGR